MTPVTAQEGDRLVIETGLRIDVGPNGQIIYGGSTYFDVELTDPPAYDGEVLTDGPLAFYKLNESTAGSSPMVDSSGYGRDGVYSISSNIEFEEPPLPAPTGRPSSASSPPPTTSPTAAPPKPPG
jgi:hypothetical protein